MTMTRELADCRGCDWYTKRGTGANERVADHQVRMLVDAGVIE